MKRCIPSKWKPTYPIIKKNHGKPSVQSITHQLKMTAAPHHAAKNLKNIPTASTFPSNSKTYYPQTQPSKPTVEQIFYFVTPPTKSTPIFLSSSMEQEVWVSPAPWRRMRRLVSILSEEWRNKKFALRWALMVAFGDSMFLNLMGRSMRWGYSWGCLLQVVLLSFCVDELWIALTVCHDSSWLLDMLVFSWREYILSFVDIFFVDRVWADEDRCCWKYFE